MTALEEQLTNALVRLSAQYEMEQRRHAELVEALQRQVERLDGRVTRLAADLRDARRDVARALELMRQPQRDRDLGPSR